MKFAGRLSLLLLILLSVILIVRQKEQGGKRLLRLRDGQAIGLADWSEAVQGIRFIFVGEDHSRKENHQAQLEIIKRLQRAGVPLAIGLEMFTTSVQGDLDRWVAGKLSLDSFIRLYYSEWAMPWPLYRDIFLYARAQRIPLVALNVPHDISHKVAHLGFATLTAEERKRLPAGITCSTDPVYRAFIRRAYAEHDHDDKSFIHFCEAQMLWNKSMARYLLEYQSLNPQRTLVVLTGIGHAMRRGAPAELFRESGAKTVVVLPELPDFRRDVATSEDADYLLLFNGF